MNTNEKPADRVNEFAPGDIIVVANKDVPCWLWDLDVDERMKVRFEIEVNSVGVVLYTKKGELGLISLFVLIHGSVGWVNINRFKHV